jgi:hypothetical protein
MRLWRYFRSDNMMAKQSGSNETEKKHNPKKTRKQDVNEKKKMRSVLHNSDMFVYYWVLL